MANYNGYYPQYFQPNPVYAQNQSYPQNQQQFPQNQPSFPQNQQIQNGGFMLVANEEMARTYPVAPGNCVTFKIEGKPIVMEKSMGFSQLEAPRIEKYKLVREEDNAPNEQNSAQIAPKLSDTENEALEEVKREIKGIFEDIDDIKKRLEKVEDMGA